LRAAYAAMQASLEESPFRKPLLLQSSESSNSVQGDVHAVVQHPFGMVRATFADAGRWCDVLMLHLNLKQCRRTIDAGVSRVEVRIGRKSDQPPAAASPVDFDFRPVSASADYLAVELLAMDGPMQTHDYRILLEAVPLDQGRTFIHMSYAFGYGTLGRVAMKLYLGTVARDKVGFTVERAAGAGPRHVDGMRGVVERNTMRYYLAIEAYLGSLASPPETRVEKSLQDWFDATEHYPRQLHEIDRVAYLSMKRRELARSASAPQ
jgi:hypothetical protein